MRLCLCTVFPTSVLWVSQFQSIDALCYALNKFEGSIVLVSHDARLITEFECQLYICMNNKLIKYSGDFEDYKTEILKEIEN